MRQYRGFTYTPAPKTAWDSLSMLEKSEMMKVAVRNGITDLKTIKEQYNEFVEGGYLDWKEKASKYKHLDIDNDRTYDYEGWYNENPQRAWNFLNDNPDAHFDDKYKTAYHPTFSTQSRYSGVVDPVFNPDGLVGGTWNKQGTVFTMSPDGYRGPVSMDERKWYLENAEDNGAHLREANGNLPVFDSIPWGGVLPNVIITGNKFADGGEIHIKPENRGKFTALKERTGHSATWFKEHGTPAQKKMATFALNARHWKHGEGGNLFEEAGQMQIGSPFWQSQTQKPTFMESLAEFNRQQDIKKQQQRQALREKINTVGKKLAEERIREASVESNDNAWVETPLTYRKKNTHLSRRAEEGAKAHAAWEKEHPNLTAWGNLAGAVPFVVASVPLGAGMVAGGDALAATTAGQAVTSGLAPLYQAATGATIAGAPALTWADAGLTSTSIAHGASETLQGKFTPITALEISPAGRTIKVIPNIEKRAAETAMRTTPLANPLPEIENELAVMWKGQDGGRSRIAHILDYVLTGAKTGPKGYYNSFAKYVPIDNSRFVTNPTLQQRWHDFNNPSGVSYAYSGFVDDLGHVPAMTERNDMIDAFLYGKDIDSSFGLTKVAKGKDFGHHTDYVNQKYGSKANNISVYEVSTPDAVNTAEVTPSNIWSGANKGLFYNGKGENLNVAGHRFTTGTLQDGTPVKMEQDIWKFQPDEYYAKWLQNQRKVQELPKWKQRLLYYGLKEVDRMGTPVITRTQWHR